MNLGEINPVQTSADRTVGKPFFSVVTTTFLVEEISNKIHTRTYGFRMHNSQRALVFQTPNVKKPENSLPYLRPQHKSHKHLLLNVVPR